MNHFVGWQSELEVALTVKQRIFLHGNVFDLYMHENKPYRLTGWLVQQLQQRGYELILGYDVVDGQTILHGQQEHLDEILRSSPSQPEQQREEPQEPGETADRDVRENRLRSARRQSPPRGMAPLGRRRRSSQEQSELVDQLQRLRRVLENNLHSTALICTHCDKLVAHGQLFNIPERKHSVLVSKLTELTWDVQSWETRVQGLQNLVILIYDQEGLLPVELYLNDPTAKVVHIPYPNFETRSSFFNLNWERFYGYEELDRISYIEPTETSDGAKPKKPEEVKNYETFARLTEGFSMQELYQLTNYSHARTFSITDFRQLLTFFRSGKRDNPWDSITDAKIRRATVKLEHDVVGQRDAIRAVVDMLHRAKAELSRVGARGTMKPRGILFFVGPTGVGKTLLASKLAEILFETEEACTIFDMSEFKEEHTISRLIGSPPGYIGHDTGGELTNKMRERPFSVLLFDEIEKANKRILDIFLQILESGRLTDGKGQTVSFSEAIIIFTSNIGTKPDRKVLRVLQKNLNRPVKPEQLHTLEKNELTEYFSSAVEAYFTKGLNRPELFNRLGDNIVVFNYLTTEDCNRISKRTISEYFDRISKRWREKWGSGANLQFDREKQIISDIQDLVLKEQKFLEYGARGLENMIISKLETPLARLFNDSDLPRNLTCSVKVNNAGEVKIDSV